MAINTQKLLPGSGSTTKALPQAKITTIPLTSEDKKKVNTIRVKTIQVDKILKGTLAADKKRLTDKKRAASQERKQKLESQLEKKPEKNKKFTMPRVLPRMGIWDWIKNFIGSIILGYFAYNMIDHADKLKGTLTTILKITDFVIDWGGKLFNGLVTFIDWGYNFHDWTKGIAEKLGIEGPFTAFIGAVDKLITLLVAIAAVRALTPDWAKGKGKGPKPKGPKGKPRSWQNKGWRLPWQKPKVSTGTGGKPRGFRIPGTGPKVTTGGPKPKFKVPGLKGGKGGGIVGLIMLIPTLFEAGGLISQGKWKTATNILLSTGAAMAAWSATMAGAGAAAAALTGVSMGLGSPAAIGLLITGVAAATAASMGAYSASTALLKKAGLHDEPKKGFSEGGVVKKKSFSPPPRKVYDVNPTSIDFLGTGEKKESGGIWGLVKTAMGWVTNPLGEIWKEMGTKFLRIKFLGPILTLVVRSLIGHTLSKKDYDDAGLGLAAFFNKGLNDGDLTGGLMAAFAAGGLVSPLIQQKQKNVAKWISKQLQDSLGMVAEKAVHDVKNIKRDSGKEKKEGGGGDGNITGESGPVSGTDQQKAKMMYDYLMTKPGMTHNKAAGIVSNIKFESGFQTDIMGDGGTSGGLFQMHAGRLTRMEKAVPNWRNNWKGQIDYALKDDRGPEYMNMTFKSAGDAANWWMRNWERPAQELRDTREHNQRQWIKKINWQREIDPVRGTSKGPGLFPIGRSTSDSDLSGESQGPGIRDQGKGSKLAGELGRFLDKRGLGGWGSGVHQHPEHPPWPKESGHRSGSLHYESQGGRAIDIGGWGPNLYRRKGMSGTDDQTKIIAGIKEWERGKNISQRAEFAHEGNDPTGGHDDHVHVAYHKGGQVPGKGERWAKLLGGEMVIDVDSAGPAKNLLLAINQASGPQQVMKAIQDYAPYEALQSRMIPIPIPVPTGGSSASSSRPTTVIVGSGKGRTHDPFESLVAQG